MERKMNTLRILIHILFVACLSLLFNMFYTYVRVLTLCMPIITPDFSLIAWQVFSSLSPLTVALLSIVQGRVDERYYGLSIKDVLFLPKSKRAILPSYWEKVIIILGQIVVAGCFLVLNQQMAAIFTQLWSFVLLMQLLIDSIGIFTQSSKYQKIAKNYCDNSLLNLRQKNMEEVKQLVQNLGKEAEERIENDLNPKDNVPLEYLFEHIARLYKIQKSKTGENSNKLSSLEEEINTLLLSTVQKIYKTSIVRQSVPYMNSFVSKVLLIADSQTRWSYNILTLDAYYRAKMPFESLQRLVSSYKTISYSNPDLVNDLLPFTKVAIERNDEALFGEIIKSIYSRFKRSEKSVYGRFLFIIAAYMYYYCLREPIIRKEDSVLRSQLFTQDLNKQGKPLSFKDICQTKGKSMLSNFTDVLNYFKEKGMFWEIMQEGEAKFLQLDRIIREFIAYYLCFCGYSLHIFEECQRSSLEDLIEIHSTINAVINGDKKTLVKYEDFKQWIGSTQTTEVKTTRTRLLTDIEKTIREKVLNQSIEYRREREVWLNKVDTILNDTCSLVENNFLFGIPEENISAFKMISMNHSEIEDVRSFSKDVALVGFEEAFIDILQNHLFEKLCSEMRKIYVRGIEAGQQDYDQVLQIDKELMEIGIKVDTVFNYPIFEMYEYFDDDINEETKEKMREFSNRLKSGEFWTNYLNATIYLDSTKGLPHFHFHRSNFSIKEQLTDTEIDERLEQYKQGASYYPASVAPKVPFTKEESMEYLKEALFKIELEYSLFVPKETVGFYTVYQD